jgi:hypothetical protein
MLVGLCQMPSEGVMVDPLECLVQFCKSVLASGEGVGGAEDSSRVKIGICNIVLQRVGGAVRLPR